MVLYEFEGREPKIGKGTYVSESAELIGDVTIGKKCYIGPGCKIRGDTGQIVVGNKTSIQDNCVLHARPGETCKVGNMVTIGHGAILHGCTVRDHAIIGMGAIISDHSVVGVWSIVAEGCVVKNNQVVKDQKIVVGVPAKTAGEVTEEQRRLWTKNKDVYVKLAEKYLKKLAAVQ